MMVPPLIVLLKLRGRTLPLPTVLIWPLLPVAFLLAMLILPWVPVEQTSFRQRVALPFAALAVLGALRGLKVEVESSNGEAFSVLCW